MAIKKILLCLQFVFLFFTMQFAGSRSVMAQSDLGQVGLVIQFLDGRIETECIDISIDPFYGYDVLKSSNHLIIAEFNGSLGAAICRIDDEGCGVDNCFCNMPNYWTYWHLGKNQAGETTWLYSLIGASNYRISPGDVEGWRYGTGISPSEMPAFQEICLPATPTATEFTIPPSSTWTVVPVTNTSRPINTPTVWITGVMINPVITTAIPPTQVAPSVSTNTFTPTNTPTLARPSLTPSVELQSLKPSHTHSVDDSLATQPPILAIPTVTYTESSPEANQTNLPKKAKINNKQATLQSQATSIVETELAHTGLNNRVSPKSHGIIKWIMFLGGLTGIGSFLIFFFLLFTGFLVVYFRRRK